MMYEALGEQITHAITHLNAVAPHYLRGWREVIGDRRSRQSPWPVYLDDITFDAEGVLLSTCFGGEEESKHLAWADIPADPDSAYEAGRRDAAAAVHADDVHAAEQQAAAEQRERAQLARLQAKYPEGRS